MARSFLMFLFVEGLRCWVAPACLSVIITATGVSQVVLLGDPLQQLSDETILDILLLSLFDSCLQERFLPLLLHILVLVAAALKRAKHTPP